MKTIENLSLDEIEKGWHKFNFKTTKDKLGKSLDIPIVVIKSEIKSPVVTITSLIHGDEFNGLFVSQKLIEKLKEGVMKGTIIIIPIVNYPGFLKSERNYGKIDLNHIMPGSKQGIIQKKYVYQLFNKIILNSDYLIDLHSSRKDLNNIYHIRANLEKKEVRKTALMLNADVIINHKPNPTTLRGAAEENGIVALTLELGDSLVYQKDIINTAYEGIQSFLISLKIINKINRFKKIKPIICKDSYRMFVNEAGIVNIYPRLLDKIKKDQKIGEVKNVLGEIVETIRASDEGIVVSKISNPLVSKGTRVILIGKKQNN